MRTSTDVHRSLGQHLSAAFPGYEVVLTAEGGTFERPYIAVERSTPQEAEVETQREIMGLNVAFAIGIFPRKGEDAHDALLIAEDAETVFTDAILRGVVGLSRARRIPLFDYEGVPADATSQTRRPQDFARVRSCSSQLNPSPVDETLFGITAEVRLAWQRDGTYTPPQKTVKDVRNSFLNP